MCGAFGSPLAYACSCCRGLLCAWQPNSPRGAVTTRIAVLNALTTSGLVPARVRVLLWRLAGVDVHLRSVIASGSYLRTSLVSIGRGSTVNVRCVFDNRAPISIGSYVGVGPNVHFITSTHNWDQPACRAGRGAVEPISIGDGCWIGSSVVILAGVTVAEGCVLAAGAVVTRNCDAHGLYAGVPARRIRTLPM